MTAPLRRIRVHSVQTLHGSTRRIVCDDGETLTIDISSAACGTAADLAPHLAPGGEARVRVDRGRIMAVGHPRARVHPLTLDIAEAMGSDRSHALSWASTATLWHRPGHAGVDPEPATGLAMDEDGEVTVSFACAGFSVNHDTVTLRQRLPESVLAACAGRTLGEVVSIPQLDALQIHVIGVYDGPFGTNLDIMDAQGAELI